MQQLSTWIFLSVVLAALTSVVVYSSRVFPNILNWLCFSIISRLQLFLWLVHLFLPQFLLLFNFSIICLDKSCGEQPASLTISFYGLSHLWIKVMTICRAATESKHQSCKIQFISYWRFSDYFTNSLRRTYTCRCNSGTQPTIQQ